MSSINISKLINAQFDDEDTKEEVTENYTSSVSSVAKESVKRKEEKAHTFKFFSPKQREEFKSIKSKEELDEFYRKYVDVKLDALKKDTDRGLQISKSAKCGSKEWEEGNKIFNDATEQMVEFVFDVLHLKIR